MALKRGQLVAEGKRIDPTRARNKAFQDKRKAFLVPASEFDKFTDALMEEVNRCEEEIIRELTSKGFTDEEAQGLRTRLVEAWNSACRKIRGDMEEEWGDH